MLSAMKNIFGKPRCLRCPIPVKIREIYHSPLIITLNLSFIALVKFSLERKWWVQINPVKMKHNNTYEKLALNCHFANTEGQLAFLLSLRNLTFILLDPRWEKNPAVPQVTQFPAGIGLECPMIKVYSPAVVSLSPAPSPPPPHLQW